MILMAFIDYYLYINKRLYIALVDVYLSRIYLLSLPCFARLRYLECFERARNFPVRIENGISGNKLLESLENSKLYIFKICFQ